MAWFQTENRSTGDRSNGIQNHRFPQGKSERMVLGELNGQQAAPRQMASQKVDHLEVSKPFGGQKTTPGHQALQALRTKNGTKVQKPKTGELESFATSQALMQTSLQPVVRNIDADHSDILACASLAGDIMGNLFLAEAQKLPSAEFMELKQPDITPEMRAILVDWLVEVAQEYKLVQETLHLTVCMIDKYLSVAPIQRNKLQLLGVTCMFVASKFEEIYAPQVSDFSYITEETYSKHEIIDFERIVLLTLNFELNLPTTRLFLSRFQKAAVVGIPAERCDGRLEALSAYLTELSLLEYSGLKFKPSMIAAASVLLAQWLLFSAVWTPTLEYYTSYTAKNLRQTVAFLHGLHGKAHRNELPAIREKYSHPKYLCIAALKPPAILPESLFFPSDVL